MKIRIGVLNTFLKNNSRPSKKGIMGIEYAYHAWLSQYGEVCLVTPEENPEDRQLDLLVLPGGPDLSNAITGSYSLNSNQSNIIYDQFYSDYVNNRTGEISSAPFFKWVGKIPILGICLGMQAINFKMGGNITSHGVGHQISDVHDIVVYDKKLKLGGNLGEIVKVNSRHHQFIRPKDLAECFIPVGFGVPNGEKASLSALGELNNPNFMKLYYEKQYNKLDKMHSHVEAFRHVTLPIAAVQWHPEDLFQMGNIFDRGDKISHKIIEWLLDGGNFKVENPIKDSPKSLQLEQSEIKID
jgi:gamma-glutamyl-gamma-aminobutyrate hydrolase PuuD